MKQSYDIFISYRRDGGAQYARILQLMLAQRGYEVFLDYDELTDGVFSEHIKTAIKNSSVFMLVLSAHSMDRCINEDDWVRQEIMLALEEGKQIIPVDPDKSFDGIPDKSPDFINTVVNSYSRSEINFGQTLGVTVDFMIDNRIVPIVGRRNRQGVLDTAADTAIARLDKKAKLRKLFKKLCSVALPLLLLSAGVLVWCSVRQSEYKRFKSDVILAGMYMNWAADATLAQLKTVHEILGHMESLEGGTFMMGAAPGPDGSYDKDVDLQLEIPQIECKVDPYYISKYEVTIGQWGTVMKEDYDKEMANLPKTGVTYYNCLEFIDALKRLTGLQFSLPSEAEWEYAARGGERPDNTVYAGSSDPDSVAWYSKNSKGVAHECNAQISGMDANGADLFDMSGNVSEWCDTPFSPYSKPDEVWDDNKVMRGGNYDSEPYELTVTHRDPMPAAHSLSTLGLRLIIRK